MTSERKSKTAPVRKSSRRSVSEQRRESSLQMAATTVDEASKWAESFSRLMKNSRGRRLLRYFLIKEHSEENMLLWEDIERFKNESNDEEMRDLSVDIYIQYISQSARMEVSLPAGVRRSIVQKLPDPDRSLFDAAQKIALQNMERDSYQRFLTSDEYKHFKMRLLKPGEISVWSKSCDSVLANPCGVDVFADFLRAEHSDENLRFCVAVREYENAKETKDSKLQARAQQIFDRFFSADSKNEINVSSEIRKKIETQLANPKRDIFTAAQTQIYRSLCNDSFPRFIKSKSLVEYKELYTQVTAKTGRNILWWGQE